MEIRFPHRVEYKFTGPVSVAEVIGTLQANEVIAANLGPFLEDLVPGLEVSHTRLEVEEISEGSLKELFALAFIVAYQKQLEATIPPIISSLTGHQLDPALDPVVTLAFVLLLLYGADYLHKYAIERVDASVLRARLAEAVSDLSQATGRTEAQISRYLESNITRKSQLVALGQAALSFFWPSRARGDEPIEVGQLTIESEVIKAVPKNVDTGEMDDDLKIKEMLGVQVEIRATDSDRDTSGWAGVVRTVSDRRMTMRLMPGLDREALRNKKYVIGDVIILYKEKDGVLKPASFHLIRVHEDEKDRK